MPFDFGKRGMLVGHEELTFITLKKCNRKEGWRMWATRESQGASTTHHYIARALLVNVSMDLVGT